MSDRPADRRYTKTHEWLRIEDGVATVGITDFAIEHLGDLVYVQLPDVGDDLEAGDSSCEVESVKAVGEVYTPVGGEVVETNEDLSDDQSPLTSDPFGAGWLFKVKVAGDPVDGLMDNAAYDTQLESD